MKRKIKKDEIQTVRGYGLITMLHQTCDFIIKQHEDSIGHKLFENNIVRYADADVCMQYIENIYNLMDEITTGAGEESEGLQVYYARRLIPKEPYSLPDSIKQAKLKHYNDLILDMFTIEVLVFFGIIIGNIMENAFINIEDEKGYDGFNMEHLFAQTVFSSFSLSGWSGPGWNDNIVTLYFARNAIYTTMLNNAAGKEGLLQIGKAASKYVYYTTDAIADNELVQAYIGCSKIFKNLISTQL